MLTALVLICSAAVAADAHDCTRNNANTVMRVPAEFGNPATCFMHAQAYLAGSSIGRELDANERVRIICVPRESLIAATPGHSFSRVVVFLASSAIVQQCKGRACVCIVSFRKRKSSLVAGRRFN